MWNLKLTDDHLIALWVCVNSSVVQTNNLCSVIIRGMQNLTLTGDCVTLWVCSSSSQLHCMSLGMAWAVAQTSHDSPCLCHNVPWLWVHSLTELCAGQQPNDHPFHTHCVVWENVHIFAAHKFHCTMVKLTMDRVSAMHFDWANCLDPFEFVNWPAGQPKATHNPVWLPFLHHLHKPCLHHEHKWFLLQLCWHREVFVAETERGCRAVWKPCPCQCVCVAVFVGRHCGSFSSVEERRTNFFTRLIGYGIRKTAVHCNDSKVGYEVIWNFAALLPYHSASY